MHHITSTVAPVRRPLACFSARKTHGAAPWLPAIVLAAALAGCGGGGGSGYTGGGTVIVPDPPTQVNGPAWLGYGGNAQHTALAAIATQPLSRIVWRTAVDLAPQYVFDGYHSDLLAHYGSPVITSKNTVIVPVKTAAQLNYRFEAHAGATGAVLWSVDSDYVMPAHNWTPSYNITLTAGNRIYAPGAGGKVFFRDNADSASATTENAVFYGSALYSAANKAALDAAILINTPITADLQGNIFFGFTAAAGNVAGLSSGIARIGADGTGSWTGAQDVAGDVTIAKVAMNAAPAVSPDQKTLYVAVKGSAGGYLIALDSTTLGIKGKVKLIDPKSGQIARISDDSTAAPTVGPDGDVYYGVLESADPAHNSRGWLLHFNAALSLLKTPGSFGWDDTPSIVPSVMVASYTGSSSYLVMTKYNNYGRAGSGDSKNKVAVLDPNATQVDPISGKPVMNEVLTILGATPDPTYPGGVTEWCINTAAVDPFTKSLLVNNEDGYLYRWDLTTNTLSEKIRLTSGLGESYTPTAVGPDGVVYAINNAVLFAIGK